MEIENQAQQVVLSSITNIKVPGIATMAYWSILETSDSIYFVQTGSALGLGVGTSGLLTVASVVGDIVASSEAKQAAKKDLSTVLAGSTQHFCFSMDSLNQIITKKGLLGGGKVVFPNGQPKSWRESGVIKLKLSRKKFRLFGEMLQRKVTTA